MFSQGREWAFTDRRKLISASLPWRCCPSSLRFSASILPPVENPASVLRGTHIYRSFSEKTRKFTVTVASASTEKVSCDNKRQVTFIFKNSWIFEFEKSERRRNVSSRIRSDQFKNNELSWSPPARQEQQNLRLFKWTDLSSQSSADSDVSWTPGKLEWHPWWGC
jgi:hypothetical protein